MKRSRGFTLIELMIAVAIVGILAAVAYPAYLDQIRKSRRAEAQSALMNIATRQQQMLLDSRSYAATLSALNITVPASVQANYTLSLTVDSTTVPLFTATAAPLGKQVADKCGTLGVTQTGANHLFQEAKRKQPKHPLFFFPHGMTLIAR